VLTYLLLLLLGAGPEVKAQATSSDCGFFWLPANGITYSGRNTNQSGRRVDISGCGNAGGACTKNAVVNRFLSSGRYPLLARVTSADFNTRIYITDYRGYSVLDENGHRCGGVFETTCQYSCLAANNGPGNLATACIQNTQSKYYYIIITGVGSATGDFSYRIDNMVPPSTTSNTRCGSGPITLRASTPYGGTLNWYTSETGGQPVATGSSYTPVLSATKDYWVSASIGGCTSGRRKVTATIIPLPPNLVAPDVSDAVSCGPSNVTLTVTNPQAGFIYRWFTSPSGGTSINTGTSYRVNSVVSSRTYYVAAIDVTGCESPGRGEGAITFSNPPPTPTGTNDTLCAPGTATLAAAVAANNSKGGALQWFFTPIGGTPIPGGGPSLSVYVPRTTTFYVEETDNVGCGGGRASVTAFVISPPPPPNTLSDTICGPGVVSLAANGPGGPYLWFSTPMKGSPIFQGPTYSPNVSQTTPYWVAAANGPCQSSLTPVEGRVFTKAPPPMTVGDVSCGTDTLTLRATGTGGQLRWFDADSAGVQLLIGDTLTQVFNTSQNLWVEERSYATTPFVDNFDQGTNKALWAVINGVPSKNCGAVEGNALYFNTLVGRVRQAQTKPLDLRQGGVISFELKIGSIPSQGGCDRAEAGEEVTLEYALPGSNAFVALATFDVQGTYQSFTTVTQNIPAVAQRQGVRIRLRQLDHSGQGFDNWSVDNFSIDVTYLSSCASDRSLAQATIKTVPVAPALVRGDTICGPGIARLTANGTGGMIEWYDAPQGGTMVGTGGVFQPNVTASTPYWVLQSDTNGCASVRIPTEVDVREIPPPPLTVGDDICGPSLANLRTVGTRGTVRWYDMPAGGTLVNTGPDYQPFLVNTTTFYVDEEYRGCLGDRNAVTATLYPVPLTPVSVQVDTICGPGPARFEVVGGSGLLFWMDDSLAGREIGEGPVFETNLTASQDFWAFEASLRKAEGIPLPKEDTFSTQGTRGFWFVAPTDMVLNGLRVPLSDSVAADTQSISLIRISGALSAMPSSRIEVLAHYSKVSSTGLITDSLPIQAGDTIGILGIRGNKNSISTMTRFDTLMGVYPVELFSLVSPTSIHGGPPDVVSYDRNSGLGRVEFFAHPACFSGRRTLNGVVIPIPPAPMAISDSICGPGIANLMAFASDSLGTIRWFDSDSAGIQLEKGPTFSPMVDRDTTFWVEEIRLGCVSDRTPVRVIVYIVPNPPVLIPDTLCGPGIATLQAESDTLGLVRWYETDSATVAIDTGLTFSRFIDTTTTFYATYTDEHCESPKSAVTAIVYPIPLPPVAPAETHVCGPDTVVFVGKGEGGTLSWYDQPQGGVPLAMGDTFAVFLKRDKYFWVEEDRNGCIGPRTQVEGLVNIIPDPPVNEDAWICDEGNATMFAISPNRFIEWYDADSAGNRVATGDAHTVFVSDTVTRWTQIPPAAIERLGPRDNSQGGGGYSDFFSDGVRFDVLHPTTIKQVIVYPRDSGLVVVRLLNRFGEVLNRHEEVVQGNDTAALLLAFPVLPGKDYFLDAKGSTVSGLYRNATGFSVPDSTENLIITRPLNARDSFYYFFYDWKIGHCISERASVSAVAYPKATRTATYPNSPASYRASYECIDDEGWTNYYNDLETPETDDDLLLFSIHKNGQDIGTVGDGRFRLRVHASDNANEGGGLATPILAPYVSNAEGWFVMNRYWEITPNPAPQRPVRIRFYYTEADLMEVNNALLNVGDSTPVVHQDLNMYLLRRGDANPDKGHQGVVLADYQQFENGDFPIANLWEYGSKPPFHYGELETSLLTAGGAGRGGNEAGALTTGSLVLTPVGSSVRLDWKALSGFSGDYFEVERSFDDEFFEKIGEVPFNNDSIGVQPYSFVDPSPTESRLYYRVKFLFQDSSFLYTHTEQIFFRKAADSLAKIYPNPSRNRLFLEFTNIIGSVSLELISPDGKVGLRASWQEGDDLLQEVSLGQLPPGLYIYRLRFSTHTLTGKLIKVN
jgi:hypothetical protein